MKANQNNENSKPGVRKPFEKPELKRHEDLPVVTAGSIVIPIIQP